MNFVYPTLQQALWLLPFTLPVALWVCWSDLKFMKIPNKAVAVQALGWLAVGWLAVPMNIWLWGFALMAIVLVLGFIGNMIYLFGAGDAKYAAAIAPIFAGGDIRLILILYVACSLSAFIGHRLMKQVGPFRRATPDWKSWTSPKFPMGIALAAMVVFYLLAAFLPQG